MATPQPIVYDTGIKNLEGLLAHQFKITISDFLVGESFLTRKDDFIGIRTSGNPFSSSFSSLVSGEDEYIKSLVAAAGLTASLYSPTLLSSILVRTHYRDSMDTVIGQINAIAVHPTSGPKASIEIFKTLLAGKPERFLLHTDSVNINLVSGTYALNQVNGGAGAEADITVASGVITSIILTILATSYYDNQNIITIDTGSDNYIPVSTLTPIILAMINGTLNNQVSLPIIVGDVIRLKVKINIPAGQKNIDGSSTTPPPSYETFVDYKIIT